MTTTRRRRRRTAESVDRLSDAQIALKTARYEELKSQAAQLEKEYKAIQREILAEMKERGVESIDFGPGRVTRTAAKKITISVDVLRELLPTRVFNQVTTRQVDKTQLAAAVQAGTIEASVVAEASEETENAPYIRISHGTGD